MASVSVLRDTFRSKVERVREEIGRKFASAHEVLGERETELLSQLDQLEERYRGDGNTEQIEDLNKLREVQLATSKVNKNKDLVMQHVSDLDDRVRKLREDWEKERASMRRVELGWDAELETRLSELGAIKVSSIRNYKEIGNPVFGAGKHSEEESKSAGVVRYPRSIAIHPETNNVYVSDAGNYRVQIFTESLEFLSDFSEKMYSPYGMYISNNSVYVTQYVDNCLNEYTAEGKFLKSVGKQGNKKLEFSDPAGVASSKDKNRIYICDSGNNRIQCMNLNLTFNSIISDIPHPRDITKTADEIVVLSVGEHWIRYYNYAHQLIRKIIPSGEVAGILIPEALQLQSSISNFNTDSPSCSPSSRRSPPRSSSWPPRVRELQRFGILTLAVSFALLDDDLLSPLSSRRNTGVQRWLSLLDYAVLSPLVLSVCGYYLVSLFNLQLSLDPLQLNSSVAFTPEAWDQWVSQVVPPTAWAGQLWLLYEVSSALLRSLLEPSGLLCKLLSLSASCVYSVLALLLFLHSLPSYAQIDPQFRSSPPAVLFSWERALSPHSVASAYGPFRRITGVGGRPEVLLEWSNELEGEWHEFEFHYKPGNTSRAPPFLVPHQPRLDWQMWFAALSTYQRAPWVVQLINRLLHNESTVRALLRNPPDRPEFVRASRCLYHFRSEGGDWWRREKREEFVPPLTQDHQTAAGDSAADRLIYKFYWSVHGMVSRVMWLSWLHSCWLSLLLQPTLLQLGVENVSVRLCHL